ncbi:MAG: hypothetical protein WCO99_00295 [Planctomycetota bacterium]
MATTQVFRRLKATVLTAAAVIAAAVPAFGGGNWMPLLPDQDFYDFQMFAPPDSQDYEIYPELSEGVFFNYDRLYWAITPASVVGVGETSKGGYIIPTSPISPQAIVQLNNGGLQASGSSGGSVIGGIFIYGADPLQLNLNTSWMRTVMTWGNRYEGGWIYDDRGMQFSYFDTGAKAQTFQTVSEFAASSPTQIFTQTTTGAGGGGGGSAVTNSFPLTTTTITSNSPPPDHLIAQKLIQTNTNEISGGSAAVLIRRELGRRGSGNSVRFGLGPRYMQFAESFGIGYESNQYAFNRGAGATGGGQGSGVNTGSGGTGGATGGTGGATGGIGGATGGIGGATGGTTNGNTIGGVGGTASLNQSSAGDVIGIGGYDSLTGRGASSPLQTAEWETNSYNNMVGPEFSMLLEGNTGRWTFSSEFKFTAAMNFQNNLFRGANFPDSIGADYLRATFNPSVTNTASTGGSSSANTVQLQPPPLFLQVYGVGQQNATNAAEHSVVFSPIGEWRFGAQYRVTQSILLRAGYTGMWLGSIARASSNTAYRGEKKSYRYAEVKDPEQPASVDNPWVVKTSGLPSANAVPGANYTDPASPYFREDPVYNRIGPAASVKQDYVFTNGVDFGVEIKY